MQHRDRERDREKSIEKDKETEPEKESATDVAEEAVKVPCCKKLKAVVYRTNFVRSEQVYRNQYPELGYWFCSYQMSEIRTSEFETKNNIWGNFSLPHMKDEVLNQDIIELNELNPAHFYSNN